MCRGNSEFYRYHCNASRYALPRDPLFIIPHNLYKPDIVYQRFLTQQLLNIFNPLHPLLLITHHAQTARTVIH
jgi:hypothetical protein